MSTRNRGWRRAQWARRRHRPGRQGRRCHRPGGRRRGRRRCPPRRGHPARPGARPLLGDPSDGRWLDLPRRPGPGALRPELAAGRRSTACIHSTTERRAYCTARVDETADGLGADGVAVAAAFGWAVQRVRRTLPRTSWVRCCGSRSHPVTLARFGAPTVAAGSLFARMFRTPEGPGVVRRRCGARLSAAALPDDLGDRPGHHHCRASPRLAGGGRAVRRRSPTRMAALLGDLGGKIETGVRVESAAQLPPADVTMFDLAPDGGGRHPR